VPALGKEYFFAECQGPGTRPIVHYVAAPSRRLNFAECGTLRSAKAFAECPTKCTRQSPRCWHFFFRVSFAECNTRQSLCRVFLELCRVFLTLGKVAVSRSACWICVEFLKKQWCSWWICVKSVKCISAHVSIFLERIIPYFLWWCAPPAWWMCSPYDDNAHVWTRICEFFRNHSFFRGWCAAGDDYNMQYFYRNYRLILIYYIVQLFIRIYPKFYHYVS
jgi:hypothetical protein